MVTKRLRPDEAVQVLKRGHDDVARLIAGLAGKTALRPGLGGGGWSVKDLLGHLTSWEEHALAALDAWRDGMTAPVDRALRNEGLDAVNFAVVRAKAGEPYARIRSDFEAVNRRLRERIAAISEAAWDAPATPRFRRSLGARLGSLLVGASGAFGHADSHLPDLRAHVANETDSALGQAGREPRSSKKRSR